ncbi:MAG: hypothetical protein K6D02_04985 [Lachnospiraceae bacterium]|nr:hypothetical protein [Lachnospiraceae bacterium]
MADNSKEQSGANKNKGKYIFFFILLALVVIIALVIVVNNKSKNNSANKAKSENSAKKDSGNNAGKDDKSDKGGSSSDSVEVIENTILTEDGYLIELLKGSEYSEKRIDTNVGLIEKFVKTYSEHLGEDKVSLFTVPDKVTIFKDKLPEGLDTDTKAENEKYAEMVAYLDKSLSDKVANYHNLLSDLEKEKDEYIYYRTDHHWTSMGALCAYESIAKLTKNESLNDTSDLKSESVTDSFNGSDYVRSKIETKKDEIHRYNITPADTAKAVIDDSGEKKKIDSIYDEKALESEDPYTYFMSGNYGAIDVKTKTKNGKTLLLVKDSYSNSLVPFLTMNYERIFMVDLRYANMSVTEYLGEVGKPDDVIIVLNQSNIMSDRHLYNLQ